MAFCRNHVKKECHIVLFLQCLVCRAAGHTHSHRRHRIRNLFGSESDTKQTGPTIRGSDSETELLLELRLRCLYIFRHLPEPDNSIAIGSWASIERRLRGTIHQGRSWPCLRGLRIRCRTFCLLNEIAIWDLRSSVVAKSLLRFFHSDVVI